MLEVPAEKNILSRMAATGNIMTERRGEGVGEGETGSQLTGVGEVEGEAEEALDHERKHTCRGHTGR